MASTRTSWLNREPNHGQEHASPFSRVFKTDYSLPRAFILWSTPAVPRQSAVVTGRGLGAKVSVESVHNYQKTMRFGRFDSLALWILEIPRCYHWRLILRNNVPSPQP